MPRVANKVEKHNGAVLVLRIVLRAATLAWIKFQSAVLANESNISARNSPWKFISLVCRIYWKRSFAVLLTEFYNIKSLNGFCDAFINAFCGEFHRQIATEQKQKHHIKHRKYFSSFIAWFYSMIISCRVKLNLWQKVEAEECWAPNFSSTGDFTFDWALRKSGDATTSRSFLKVVLTKHVM